MSPTLDAKRLILSDWRPSASGREPTFNASASNGGAGASGRATHEVAMGGRAAQWAGELIERDRGDRAARSMLRGLASSEHVHPARQCPPLLDDMCLDRGDKIFGVYGVAQWICFERRKRPSAYVPRIDQAQLRGLS